MSDGTVNSWGGGKMIRKLGILTGKSFVVGVLTLFVLVHLIGVLFMLGALLGPGRDDLALFHGKRYSISRTTSGYDLYDRQSAPSSVLLPNVRAYYPGQEKSYIRSHTELDIIDEKRGTYERKPLSEASPEELEILERMIEVRRTD